MAHPLGDDFPREGFVQAAIEAEFAHWERVEGSTVDLISFDEETKVRWVIEAKGETSDTGLDFRTGLGQILFAMDGAPANYALAMPDTPRFERLRARITPEVRRALNLYWLVVDESAEINAIHPQRSSPVPAELAPPICAVARQPHPRLSLAP